MKAMEQKETPYTKLFKIIRLIKAYKLLKAYKTDTSMKMYPVV